MHGGGQRDAVAHGQHWRRVDDDHFVFSSQLGDEGAHAATAQHFAGVWRHGAGLQHIKVLDHEMHRQLKWIAQQHLAQAAIIGEPKHVVQAGLA